MTKPFGGLRYGCNLNETKYQASKTFFMAKIMGKNRLAAARIRIRYLEQQVKGMLPSNHPVVIYWVNQAVSEIRYLQKNMYYEPREQEGSDRITDADIQAAKAYPIDKLIDFNNGTAYAWCHEDNRPSLAKLSRINKAKCYPCNKTFDPIDVLTERDGMSFIEAVKELR